MFGGLLSDLDVPAAAKLVGIKAQVAADGSTEWVATFRLPGAPGTSAAPAAGSLEDATATRRPPLLEPLSDLQLGVRPSEPSEPAGAAPAPALEGPRSPVPGPFPLLPTKPGSANRLFPLRCSVQKYAWGKFGAESLVAKLAANNDVDLCAPPTDSPVFGLAGAKAVQGSALRFAVGLAPTPCPFH